jgi:hypothetical protein
VAVLGLPEAGVVGADGVGVGVAVLLVVGARAVERDRVVRGRRLARLEHLLQRRAGALGDLVRRGGTPELARHIVGDTIDLHRQLLQVARNPHGPARVAEVALELADDRRHDERGERRLPPGVEAVDRLEQGERRHLHEVVELLAAALIAAGELARERKEARHELLACGRIALAVVADQQPAVLARPCRARVAFAIAHRRHSQRDTTRDLAGLARRS